MILRIADSKLGSAPDIAGRNIVNPVGAILSAAMMLKFSLGLPDEAMAIESAVRNVLNSGIKTGDIGGTCKTSEFGDAVTKELSTILAKR